MATVPTVRAPHKPRPKPSRTVRLVLPLTQSYPLCVTEQQGKRQRVDYYLVGRIGSDWGDGFRVLKVGQVPDAEAYHVHLSDEGHTCDCKGFERWQHCRRVEALVALRDLGKL